MDLKPLLAVLAMSALVSIAGAITFELHKDDTKCLSEDIHEDTLVLADYSVHENAPRHKIHARVTSPDGHVLHLAEGVERGQFSFKVKESGDYLACFWMEKVAEKQATVVIDLDWKMGVAAKDWANIAKRDKIEGMELELRKLEDMASEILDQMFYLREKEDEMREFNEGTNTRIAMLGGFSLLLFMMVSLFQAMHLKKFFERKKLLLDLQVLTKPSRR